jgi:hypothetical protein
MKRTTRFAKSVVAIGAGVVTGLVAGIIAGVFLGVGIAMVFHVL